MEFTLTFIYLFFWSIYLLSPLLILFGSIITILGQIVGRIEGWTKFNALYWTYITALTVGFGDIRPLKKRSKALSVLIALFGLMFTGIIVAVTLNTAQVTLEQHPENEIIDMLKKEFKPKTAQ